MKTYRNLYREVLTDENIELAIKEAAKNHGGKNRRKKERLKALAQREDRIALVRGWIEHYEARRCKPKEIYDGISRKKRLIYVPTVEETVVQHAVVQILDKHLCRGMYEHSYAAIKGRGAHKAKRNIERYIRKKPGKVKYYLKMDVRQYFPTVPQDRLMAKLERQIKDHKMLDLIRKIIAACDEGIPLGYYISQWFANYYLTDLDHYIKERLHCDFYIRWMDDMVIFGASKRKLHRMKGAIAAYLAKEGLQLKNNWRIQRFAYGEAPGRKRCRGCFLDFMGFRFYRKRTTIRESIFYRLARKARRIGRKEKPTLYELRQFLSYIGWLDHTDSYGAYLDYVKPFVSIQYIKRRISRHDKKERRNHAESRFQACDGLPDRKAA